MLTPGTRLQNRYLIQRLIGRGGMGAVYQAVDERLGNTVALKETLVEDEGLRKAFEREARILANLDHPVLPDVSDHFIEGTGQYLIMRFMPGDDLATLVARDGPFSVEQVVRWGDQLLSALEYLHEYDPPIVHRDIKPENLKPKVRGDITLLDFGLAKGGHSGMTKVAGDLSIHGYTPHYAPLEQIQHSGTDPRSDLYSLGATLYRLVTGAEPIDALTRARAVIAGQPDPLRPAHELRPEVPVPLSALLWQAMQLNQEVRPPSAAAMRQMLHEAMQGQMPPMSDEPRSADPNRTEVAPTPGTPVGRYTTGAATPSAPAPTPEIAAPAPVSQPANVVSAPPKAKKSRVGLYLKLAGIAAVALLLLFGFLKIRSAVQSFAGFGGADLGLSDKPIKKVPDNATNTEFASALTLDENALTGTMPVGEERFFKLTIPAGGVITGTVAVVEGAPRPFRLRVYEPTQNQVDSIDVPVGSQASLSHIFDSAQSGNVFFSLSGEGQYTFQADAGPQNDASQTQDAGSDPNTALSIATEPIQGLLGGEDRTDYYSIEIPTTGGTFEAQLDAAQSGDNQVALELWDGDRDYIMGGTAASNGAFSTLSYIFSRDKGGRLFLAVEGKGSYQLSARFTPQNDGGGEGDAPTTSTEAVAVKLDTENTGQLGDTDNEDLFAFMLPTVGGRVKIETQAVGGSPQIALLNHELDYVKYVTTTGGSDPVTIEYMLPEGTGGRWFVQAQGKGDYRWTATFAPQNDAGSGGDATAELDTAAEVELGDVAGEMADADKSDSYILPLPADGGVMVATLSVSTGDARLVLYAPDQTYTTEVQATEGQKAVELRRVMAAGQGGKWFLQVNGSGQYTVTSSFVEQNDANSGADAPNEPQDAPEIALDEELGGEMGDNDDADYFLVDGEAGEYTLTLRTVNGAGSVYIYDATSGNVLASDNTDSSGKATLTFEATGPFHIRLQGRTAYAFTVTQEEAAPTPTPEPTATPEATPTP